MRNYGVGNTKAIAAWNLGATGAGINVGVVDSGIDFSQPDLAGRISTTLSTDIVAGRNLPQGDDQHGTRVSGIIAAGFNGFGAIGVAYESTIVSIRADTSNCSDPTETVCFSSGDLARAIDYAIANNIRVVNMSLGGETPLGANFEAALQRGVDHGIVFTMASGNEAGASPEWPGRYASDPRYRGSIIVVGSHNAAEVMSSFSNLAGVSAAVFLSAPGEDVLTGCDGASCWRVNGTSFSSPAVAGALALLMDAFPNLTGRQAVEILLTTARDAGSTGVDTVFGRGLLDIAQAFQPVGSTNVNLAGGATLSVSTQRFAYTGAAFGDAVQIGQGLRTIGRDRFDRLFRVDLAGNYGLAPRGETLMPQASRQQAQLTTQGPFGTTLSLTTSASIESAGYDLASATSVLTPWLDEGRHEDVMLEFSSGAGVMAFWNGRNGAHSPFVMGAGDGFASLAQVDQAWLGAIRLGKLTLSADTGSGGRSMPFQVREDDVSSYARFVAGWDIVDGARLKVAVGGLDEKMGPLGSYAPLNSGLALPSETAFGSVGGQFVLSDGLLLTAEMGFARTEMDSPFMSLSEAAISSTWNLGLTTFCGDLGFGCESLTWSASQPLRTESGMFSAYLADAPLAYFDPETFSVRRFSARPSGRQIDLALASVHRLGDSSALDLRAVVTRDEGNIAASPAVFTLAGRWRRSF